MGRTSTCPKVTKGIPERGYGLVSMMSKRWTDDRTKTAALRFSSYQKTFPGRCEMKVADPDGHVLRFGSDPKKEA